jgi:hypothetical protein
MLCLSPEVGFPNHDVFPRLSAATETIVDFDKRDLREPDAGGTKFCQNFEESDLVIWSTARTPPE